MVAVSLRGGLLARLPRGRLPGQLSVGRPSVSQPGRPVQCHRAATSGTAVRPYEASARLQRYRCVAAPDSENSAHLSSLLRAAGVVPVTLAGTLPRRYHRVFCTHGAAAATNTLRAAVLAAVAGVVGPGAATARSSWQGFRLSGHSGRWPPRTRILQHKVAIRVTRRRFGRS